MSEGGKEYVNIVFEPGEQYYCDRLFFLETEEKLPQEVERLSRIWVADFFSVFS